MSDLCHPRCGPVVQLRNQKENLRSSWLKSWCNIKICGWYHTGLYVAKSPSTCVLEFLMWAFLISTISSNIFYILFSNYWRISKGINICLTEINNCMTLQHHDNNRWNVDSHYMISFWWYSIFISLACGWLCVCCGAAWELRRTYFGRLHFCCVERRGLQWCCVGEAWRCMGAALLHEGNVGCMRKHYWEGTEGISWNLEGVLRRNYVVLLVNALGFVLVEAGYHTCQCAKFVTYQRIWICSFPDAWFCPCRSVCLCLCRSTCNLWGKHLSGENLCRAEI